MAAHPAPLLVALPHSRHAVASSQFAAMPPPCMLLYVPVSNYASRHRSSARPTASGSALLFSHALATRLCLCPVALFVAPPTRPDSSVPRHASWPQTHKCYHDDTLHTCPSARCCVPQLSVCAALPSSLCVVFSGVPPLRCRHVHSCKFFMPPQSLQAAAA